MEENYYEAGNYEYNFYAPNNGETCNLKENGLPNRKKCKLSGRTNCKRR